jgi:hypothetical protein
MNFAGPNPHRPEISGIEKSRLAFGEMRDTIDTVQPALCGGSQDMEPMHLPTASPQRGRR